MRAINYGTMSRGTNKVLFFQEVNKEEIKMHIEVEGRKYLDKIILSTEAGIKKKYKNNKDVRNDELDKLSTSTRFLNEFCKVVSKNFNAASDWRIMRDTDLTDGTACVISFVNNSDNDFDKEYSPDNMPENSVSILYCPEEAYVEILIGNDSVFAMRFEPGNTCQCKCASLYKEKNNEMYTMILNSIKIACNNLN